MRAPVFLVLILVWCQKIDGKEIIEDLGVHRYQIVDIKYDRQIRSITDIWDSIKNTARRAWEYMRNLAINTKKRLTDWVEKLRIKAQDLETVFKEQINKMKRRVNEVIKNVMTTGENVKKCLEERKTEIDEILTKILLDVTNCISGSLKDLPQLKAHYKSTPNETEFLKVIQNDIDICVKKHETNDEVEECIQNVRKGIYRNMEVTEEQIIQHHTVMRKATDDLLNTIIGCTTEGIIKSTTVIANETLKIIECVSNKGVSQLVL